jgi:hypothetical protein
MCKTQDFKLKLSINQPELFEKVEILGEYINTYTRVLVKTNYGLCEALPQNLLKGFIPTIQSAINPTEYFINQAKEIHGNKYDYSLVKYINVKTKVRIICPVFGEFFQFPDSHLRKRICNNYKKAKNSVITEIYCEEYEKKLKEKLKIECSFYESLKEFLQCDFETGLVKWIKTPEHTSFVKIGDTAGFHDSRGYIIVSFQGKSIKAHRFIYYCYYKELPEFIDHKDRIRNNNKILNLRKSTKKENAHNIGISSKNTSGIQGVRYHKTRKKWLATININKKQTHLGLFKTIEEAAKARKEAELLYYPFRNQEIENK